jgi:hypothetical protein
MTITPEQGKDGRVAIIITPSGISTISFLGSERKSISFLNLIQGELDLFEMRLRQLIEETKNDKEH